MANDDNRLVYFADALKARGIEMEPWKLQAFADKKYRGETESQIIQRAEEGTRSFKSRRLTKLALQGTAIGAVVVPAGDCLKEGRPSWREVVKRARKTAALGVVLGTGAGWAVSKLLDHANADYLKAHWDDFKRTTHEMDMAWTEALAKQAVQDPSAAAKERGPA